MKAAVLHEFGKPLSIEDVPVPEPGAGEILIRVEACGVCHSDLHLMEADWEPLRAHTKLPLILGHEVAGAVEALGDGVTGFEVGDRVGVPWLHWTCGECEYCRGGRETLCSKQVITGVTVDGGYAEYVKAKASHAARLPGNVAAAEAAPLLCAGLTVHKALKSSDIHPGQRLAVYGVGGLGHLAVQLAKAQGIEVCAVDLAEDKLELARACGADSTFNFSAGERPPRSDVAMVCAASAGAYEAAIGSLRRGGTLMVVGMPAEPIPMSAVKLVAGELRILSSAVGTRADLRELLALAAGGAVRCRIEKRRLDEISSVFHRMKRGEIAGRAVLAFR